MLERYCMLCSVGISSERNLNLLGQDEEKERIIDEIRNFQKYLDNTKENPLFPPSLHDVQKEKYTAFSDPKNKEGCLEQKFPFPSAESNAAIRWILDTIKKLPNEKNPFSCDIHLFPGKELGPRFTAWVTSAWIDAACHFGLFGSHGENINVEIHTISFEVDDPQHMYRGVSALFEEFDDVRKEAREASKKVLINATGGYKVITGFSLLYAQIHSLPCIYIYEENNAVLELQALPLSFAVGALDEEIGLLKGMETLIEQGLLTEESYTKLPSWVQGLLLKEGEGYSTSHLSTTLIDHFAANRRKNSGVGRRLLDMLAEGERNSSLGDALRSYLEARIQKEWAELWMGDQIPETVEHSRRHSKRLMEIGGHLLESARDVLKPEGLLEPLPLALLISCIYLHDIGHTALGFPVDGDGLGSAFPLGMFPTTVREVHHLLSRDMIRSKKDTFFPNSYGLDDTFVEALRELVPDITAYHRGYTKLAEPKQQKDVDKFNPNKAVRATGELLYGAEEFEQALYPLKAILGKKKEKLAVWGLNVDTVLGVTGLLRFIDGCDVQADRVVDPAYLKARLERTKYEARMLHRQIAPFEGFLKGIVCEDGRHLWDLLGKMRRCEDISLKQALGEDGGIEKGLQDEVKSAKELIYPSILKELGKMCSREGDFTGLLLNSNLLPLSLANRIAFKWEQFLHFQKHSGVEFVLPTKKNGRPVILLQGKGKLESVRREIKGELEKVHACGVLEELEIRGLDEPESSMETISK